LKLHWRWLLRISRTLIIVMMSLLTLASTAVIEAQTSSNTEQGAKPNDATSGGDIDSVSLTSGSLFISVPLAAFPQRGDLGLSFSFRHASKQWVVKATKTTPVRYFWAQGGVPQGVVSNLDYIFQNTQQVDTTSPSGVTVTQNVMSPDGNLHPV